MVPHEPGMESRELATFHGYRVIRFDQLAQHVRDQDYHVLYTA